MLIPLSGYPEPDKTLVFDTSETLDIDNVPLNGGILIKVLELSADPYMRGRMRDASIPSFFVRLRFRYSQYPVGADVWPARLSP